MDSNFEFGQIMARYSVQVDKDLLYSYGETGEVDHPIPEQIDHLLRGKLTTPFRTKLTTP